MISLYAMKEAIQTLAQHAKENAYLFFVGGFGLGIVWGLVKLYAMLKGLQV